MKALTATIGIAMWLSCAPAGAVDQESVDLGKMLFESRCATCHGLDGKGDGPQAQTLPKKPANLTTLAKRHGGVFPTQHVKEVIDGRVDVLAHGPREMPVWGRIFQVNVPEVPPDVAGNFSFPETTVRNKIQALIDYLSQLQDMK
jgi:mono/diheme cytochrome c family protein